MIESGKARRRRRHHDDEFKQQLLAECAEPGASVARVALLHGINANLLHTWRREARDKAEAAAAAPSPPPPSHEPAFIAVAVAPSPAPVAGDIRIDLRRGATTVSVTWPLVAAGECAAWLREILR